MTHIGFIHAVCIAIHTVTMSAGASLAWDFSFCTDVRDQRASSQNALVELYTHPTMQMRLEWSVGLPNRVTLVKSLQ